MRPVTRVLIANRGEIAVRVIRACRDLGLESVCVYSEADADALHVRLADHAVEIGPAQARASYLVVEKIVAAALACGAQAVHPGYGFLAEQPELPTACAAAGLVFIGPPSAVMVQVGDKIGARAVAERAGVPVVPGSGLIERAEDAIALAEQIGYPILLKAAAGGGGRGIRRVDAAEDLAQAFAGASKEAAAAFGDGSMFIEKMIAYPHHVEVQIIADEHGSVVHLFERECSLQRRKQKLIEESPAPSITAELRAALCESAVVLARAVGYRNAGTVEFIVDVAAQQYYFIEVNARIQVEHGVTEMVTGRDLIVEQIRVALGERLSFAQDDVTMHGAAIEFRINAEDPTKKFFPSPGTIAALHLPGGPGVRVDTGVEVGGVIPPYYDSMVAKLLVWGCDREQAIARSRRALSEMTVAGIATTRDLHLALLDWPGFRAATAHTEALEPALAAGEIALPQQN